MPAPTVATQAAPFDPGPACVTCAPSSNLAIGYRLLQLLALPAETLDGGALQPPLIEIGAG